MADRLIAGSIRPPLRSPWKLKYNSLKGTQTIIDYENCHNGRTGVSWIPGWCIFYPSGSVVLDLQTITLVTKISFYQANCLARASSIQVSCSNYPDGPFIATYNLIPTQSNRRVSIPINIVNSETD